MNNLFKFLIFTLIFTSCFEMQNINKTSEPTRSDSTIRQEKQFSKIVTMSSLSADLVNRISPEKLIGIPGSSLLKKDPSFDNKNVISSGQSPPNLEQIIALQPDLVMGVGGMHDLALNQLQELGIDTLSITVKNWENLTDVYLEISEMLGVEKNNIENEMPNCFEISELNSDKSSVLILASMQPLLSPTSASWAGQLASRAGLKNLAANFDSNNEEYKGYVTISEERLVDLDPENIIIIDFNNIGEQLIEDLKTSTPFFAKLTAVKESKITLFPYYGLINPGNFDSINSACKKLNLMSDGRL